jgi:multiple sugar transport system ATP-binding protein
MTRVRLESLTKRFSKDALAVDALDLQIESGELMVLVGPSGCGKSTTLRMIAGLESPTAGSILFDTEDVTDKTPRERDVAMVFQNYALYPHMTVERNLMFPLRMRKVARGECRAKAHAMAEKLGLSELLQRKPRELSGGQQQRVALGRALIREPRIFLLDEPLSNLDAKTRISMRAEIKRLHQELQTTMVYVTHDQSEAMALGDRIAVLRRGLLEQLATPKELYERPRNRFVGSFIGSPAMEFHPAQRGQAGLALAGTELRGIAPPSRNCLVGLRPHELEVRPAPGQGATLEGQVLQVEAHGHESFVRTRVGNEEITGVAQGIFEAQTGSTVHLALRTEQPRYFDAESGAAL